MSNISTAPVNFNFHGDNLVIVPFNGQPFVAMKPIVESMGLYWSGQQAKLAEKFSSVIQIICTTGSDGKSYEMLCLPLRKLAAWLYSVNPNKVAPELRDKVIAYQEECDDALWDYWNQGFAVRQSFVSGPGDILSAAQAEQIRMSLKSACEKLPKDKQAAFMTKGWSKLKSHFGVTYRKIPQHEFTEAISIVSRHVAEWELVEAPKKTTSEQLQEFFQEGYFLMSFQNGSIVLNPVDYQHRVIAHKDSDDLARFVANDVPVAMLTKVIDAATSRINRLLDRKGQELR